MAYKVDNMDPYLKEAQQVIFGPETLSDTVRLAFITLDDASLSCTRKHNGFNTGLRSVRRLGPCRHPAEWRVSGTDLEKTRAAPRRNIRRGAAFLRDRHGAYFSRFCSR